MQKNAVDFEKFDSEELQQRILYMFYQNVRSLSIGIIFLFSFFMISHLFLIEDKYPILMTAINGFTVLVSIIVLYLLNYKKIPQNFIYQTVSILILLVVVDSLIYMNLHNEPLWIINILLILIGLGIFMLSFRWFAFIATTVVAISVADIMYFGITENFKVSLALLFLAYYFAFIVNYLRLSSTNKFQTTLLELQNKQSELENVINEFTQAKNFAESLNQLVPSAIFSVDLYNVIRSWNNKAEEVTGFSFADVKEKTTFEIFGSEIFMVNYANKNSEIIDHESELTVKSGKIIKIIFSLDLLENDTFYGATVSFEDITERKEAEENLALRDKILQALTVSSNTFLTKPNWESNIKEILRKYGELLNVDRVYLFENVINDTGYMCMRYKHGWFSERSQEHKLSIDPNRAYSYKNLDLENWLFLLLARKTIHGNLSEIAPDNEFLYANNVKSLLIVPIFVKDMFWGFITFDVIADERNWNSMEVETLTMVADSIGAAINRKKNEEYLNQTYDSLVKELEIAASVQNYLLPDWLTKRNEIIFSSTYKPSSQIGGDLFDIIEISPTKTIVYIGDISGHGVQAALIMTAVKSIIKMIVSAADEQISPSYILQKLNQTHTEDLFQDNYLTILLCLIDTEKEEISYFNAGHPPMIQYDLENMDVELINQGGSVPIGWSKKLDYLPEEEGKIEFSDRKAYMLFTDGIFECENKAGEQFGIAGFNQFVAKQTDFSSCISLPSKFKQRLEDLKYDISTDDFTLLSFARFNKGIDLKHKKFLIIKPDLKYIAGIGRDFYYSVKELFESEKFANSVELVVNEYLTNIIKHGLDSTQGDVIGLELEIGSSVSLTFWDQGIAWNLPERDESVMAANKEKSGGFGLQIIHSFATAFSLERYGEINITKIVLEPKEI